MKRVAHFVGSQLVVFISGWIVCANMTTLYDLGDGYHAGLWKIVFAALIATGFSLHSWAAARGL